MNYKKFGALLFSILLVFSFFPAISHAMDNIIEVPDVKVIINGRNVTFSDVIISSGGRTLLPLRSLLTNLGVQNDNEHILWNSAEKSVTILKDTTKIKLVQGNDTAYVNDIPVKLDVPPVGYKNGKTYIPVKFVAQSLGEIVDWDSNTKSVTIKDPRTVTVGTAEELVTAMDSDTKIILKKGVYNLSKMKQEYSENKVFWEGVFDGNQLVIKGVRNLTLEGEAGAQAEIVVEPRYANIFSFRDCSNIVLRNIKAGHTPEQGECAGGVLVFSDSGDISMVNTELYGCGIEGLTLSNTNSLLFADSVIDNCNSAIMTLYNSKYISFYKSKFSDNKGYSHAVGAYDNCSVTFDDCDFANNQVNGGFFGTNLSKILVSNSRFTGNSYSSLASESPDVILVNTKTEENAGKQ